MRSLAIKMSIEVWCAYEQDLPASRRAMGWKDPDFGPVGLADVRHVGEWRRLTGWNDPSTVHVFGSYFIFPRMWAAFRELRQRPCRRVWVTEAFEPFGWQGLVRMGRARWHVLRDEASRFERVFAMGGLGVEFCRRSGLPAQIVREFGYTVETPVNANESLPPAGEARFTCVGQLIPRKGVDLLLSALSVLVAEDWRLDILGDGTEAERLVAIARSHGLGKKVHFQGNCSNEDARRVMGRADVLFLPSRWDGWGATTNEALLHGTRVVASHACGSATLLVHESLGRIFPRNDVAALVAAIRREITDLVKHRQGRIAVQQWANNVLRADNFADYFIGELLYTDKRVVPWRDPASLQQLVRNVSMPWTGKNCSPATV